MAACFPAVIHSFDQRNGPPCIPIASLDKTKEHVYTGRRSYATHNYKRPRSCTVACAGSYLPPHFPHIHERMIFDMSEFVFHEMYHFCIFGASSASLNSTMCICVSVLARAAPLVVGGMHGHVRDCKLQLGGQQSTQSRRYAMPNSKATRGLAEGAWHTARLRGPAHCTRRTPRAVSVLVSVPYMPCP